MAPSKPRNASYKDVVVAELSLNAHFLISDTYPKETSSQELTKLMHHHNPKENDGNPSCHDHEHVNIMWHVSGSRRTMRVRCERTLVPLISYLEEVKALIFW